MAYNVNGKTFSNHALMDEVVFHTKLILSSIVLKNDTEANENETELSVINADYLMAILNDSMELSFFPFTMDLLTSYGYSTLQAKTIINDRSMIPDRDRDSLLQFANKYFVDNYVEYNNYYRTLMGLPNYGTTEYDLYVDYDDPRLVEDDFNTNFDFSAPIHTYSSDQINVLEALGIIKDLRSKHPGSKYKYLDFLGAKKIDIATARTAANWDILYIPNVEYLVKSRFKELYAINRDIYQFRTYQEAYKIQSNYYDEFVMIMIIAQTFADIVTELPEWYIRRDVFDLRTVQYFLESQGVKFFKQIPLKYQIRIVKNLNRLIKYKSTNKNVYDILDIFSIDGTKVYKYYLYKKYLYTTHAQIDVTPPPPTIWEMENEYDFYFEDDYEESLNFSESTEVFDFLDENSGNFDPSVEQHIYDFINESADVPDSSEETDRKEEIVEEQRIILDEYGNVYDLEFVKVPIGESYDDYIKNNLYKEDYDTVTQLDPYWDGEDTHAYVRNKHLERDFTIEGTKYMFLDYTVSMREYSYQMSYFMSMIFSTKNTVNDIKISIPGISTSMEFGLRDICMLLYCLSMVYSDKSQKIKRPSLKTKKKHDFYKYLDMNGGMFYDGTVLPDPILPEPDPEWEMDPEYEFGLEGRDNIKYDPLYGELFDFGFNSSLKPGEVATEVRYYDFGLISKTSLDYTNQVQPNANKWLLGDLYDFGNEAGNEEGLEERNYVGDNPNYNFRDEFVETEDLVLTDYSKIYDFRSADIHYIEYEETPKVPYEPPKENWWDNIEPAAWDLELNGQKPNIKRKFRMNIDGGNIPHSLITIESFYDWMKNKYPEQFIPTAGKIYGFNLNVDLDKVREEIANRHSDFGFDKGYTLTDFGAEGFVANSQIDSIEELLRVYKRNADAYNNLVENIEQRLDTRDKYNTMMYIFNSLFTLPFDTEFYRLKNGQIADTYDQLLKEKNFTLYKYYQENIAEQDKEVRQDNIRNVLNDIVSTLEYYLNAEDTEYIFSWVPTNSFEAIVSYISLMINFFKSWKVYFLDPKVTYVLDSRMENKVGNGDKIAEIKASTWYRDKTILKDALQIKPIYYFKETNAGMSKEVVDIYGYFQGFVTDDYDYDGMYVDTNMLSEIDLTQFDFINGGTSNKEAIYDYLIMLAGNAEENVSIIAILEGGQAIDVRKLERYQIDALLPVYIQQVHLDGGVYNTIESAPYAMINGGVIGARKDTFNMDGAGPLQMQDYLDIDGMIVSDMEAYYPIFNDFSYQPYEVDGGGVDKDVYYTSSAKTKVINRTISTDAVVSSYDTNDIVVLEDGLYLGGDFTSQEEFEFIKEHIVADRYNYEGELNRCIDMVRMISNEEALENSIDNIFSNYFLITTEVLNDNRHNTVLNNNKKYIDSSVSDLKNWFKELDVFGWEYF